MTKDTARTEAGFVYRELRRRDLGAILKLERLIFDDAWPREAFEDHLKSAKAGGLVVETDGAIIGYACHQLTEPYFHLTNLAVAPAHRRKSVAKGMLDRILGMARRHDCEFIYLEVRVSNQTARKFYEAAGFSVIDRCKDYYEGPTEDALVMMLEVN